MAYQIQLINDQKFVRICHKDIVDISEMNHCKNTAIIHLKKLGWNRVLIDITDAEFQVGTLDIANMYKDLDSIFSEGASIAVLQPTQMAFDYGQYSKTIATAWSNTKVEIFVQENLAVKWFGL